MLDADTTTTADAAESMRYVFIEWPRCPACGSRDLKTRKTVSEPGDDSVTRDTLCLACGRKFFVVVE